jgi:hypothetical protein
MPDLERACGRCGSGGAWGVESYRFEDIPRINSDGESELQRMWKIFTLQNCILPELLCEDGRRNYKTHETSR